MTLYRLYCQSAGNARARTRRAASVLPHHHHLHHHRDHRSSPDLTKRALILRTQRSMTLYRLYRQSAGNAGTPVRVPDEPRASSRAPPPPPSLIETTGSQRARSSSPTSVVVGRRRVAGRLRGARGRGSMRRAASGWGYGRATGAPPAPAPGGAHQGAPPPAPPAAAAGAMGSISSQSHSSAEVDAERKEIDVRPRPPRARAGARGRRGGSALEGGPSARPDRAAPRRADIIARPPPHRVGADRLEAPRQQVEPRAARGRAPRRRRRAHRR